MRAGSLFNGKTALIVAVIPFVAAWLQGSPSPAGEGNDNSTNAVVDAAPAPGPDLSPTLQATNLPPLLPNPLPPGMQLYGGAQEVVKMAQAGIGDDVILAYITNANVQFGVTPDEIIYLNDLGVSGTVVTSMMKHDQSVSMAGATTAPNPAPMPLTPAAGPAPALDNTNPPPPMPEDTAMVNPPPDNPDYSDNGASYPGDYPQGDDTGYFYNSLVPYGAWIYVAGTGICWQPTVCLRNHDWRPYCDRGRWLYSDCGWYWQSDYSWGWAAFHYGRWFCDPHRGWMWQPNRVWGPSWVVWRANQEHCGWAPMPPSAVFVPGVGFMLNNQSVSASSGFGVPSALFTFIPVERMGDYAPSRYAVPSWQTEQVFSDSRPLSSVTIRNQRVANLGMDPRIVDARAGVRVRRAAIQEVPGTDANGRVQSDHLGRHDGSLVIFRPQLPPPAQPRQGTIPSPNDRGVPRPRTGFAAPGMATPTRTPTVLGATANQNAQTAGMENPRHVQVYQVTHPDPKPAGTVSWYTPGTPQNSAAHNTVAETYPPNSMVLDGRQNLSNPQWDATPPVGTQIHPNRPVSSAGYEATPAYSGRPQNYGNPYYRPSAEATATSSPGGNYHPSGYAPVQQQPYYRASQPQENYSASTPGQSYTPRARENYAPQVPQETYSAPARQTSAPQQSYSPPPSTASSSRSSSTSSSSSSSSSWSSSSSSSSGSSRGH
jgi:hypothetical protein